MWGQRHRMSYGEAGSRATDSDWWPTERPLGGGSRKRRAGHQWHGPDGMARDGTSQTLAGVRRGGGGGGGVHQRIRQPYAPSTATSGVS